MTARDELAELIQDCGEYVPGSHADDYISPDKAADAILAAGYRKPRTITTEVELDALPSGSVILGSDGEPNVLHDNGWVLPGGVGGYTSWAVAQTLPATVLYEPEPQP